MGNPFLPFLIDLVLIPLKGPQQGYTYFWKPLQGPNHRALNPKP